MPLATLRGRARGPQRPAAVAAPVAGSTSSTLHSLLHPTSTLGAHGRLCWLLSSCLMRAAHALQTRAACSASLRERCDRMCSIRSSLSVSIANSSYCRAPLGRVLQFSGMKVLTSVPNLGGVADSLSTRSPRMRSSTLRGRPFQGTRSCTRLRLVPVAASAVAPPQLLLDDAGRAPLLPDTQLPLLHKRVLVTGKACAKFQQPSQTVL